MRLARALAPTFVTTADTPVNQTFTSQLADVSRETPSALARAGPESVSLRLDVSPDAVSDRRSDTVSARLRGQSLGFIPWRRSSR